MISFHPIAANGRAEKLPVPYTDDALTYCAATVVNARGRLYKKPWTGYLVCDGAHIVGGGTFETRPVADRLVLSFEVFAPYRGRGYDAAILRALLKIAAIAAPAATLVAHTPPAEDATTTTLEKNGFTYVGMVEHTTDGLVWLWERPAAQKPAL